jgi:predicted hotdog family 3-hydroxylacyl-ACP dehydratase
VIEKDELPSIIPHRGKMLLLDRIIAFNPDEGSLEAEYHITEDCLFFDPAFGGVPGWAAFEFMAQAISALSGLRSRARGEKPRMGFILSVSSTHIGLPLLRTGSTAEIHVKEISSMDLVYTFEGVTFLEGAKVLEGKITVMELDEKQAQTLIIKERDSIE